MITYKDCPECGANKIHSSVRLCEVCETCEKYESKIDFLRAEIEMLRGVGCREVKDDEPESGPCGVCLRCAEDRGAAWALEIALDPLRWPVSKWTPEEVCRDARGK